MGTGNGSSILCWLRFKWIKTNKVSRFVFWSYDCNRTQLNVVSPSIKFVINCWLSIADYQLLIINCWLSIVVVYQSHQWDKLVNCDLRLFNKHILINNLVLIRFLSSPI